MVTKLNCVHSHRPGKEREKRKGQINELNDDGSPNENEPYIVWNEAELMACEQEAAGWARWHSVPPTVAATPVRLVGRAWQA